MFHTLKQGSRQIARVLNQQCVCHKLSRLASTAQDRPESSLLHAFKKASGDLSDGAYCRTSLTNPKDHSLNQEGLFYTINKEDYQRWLVHGIPKEFTRLMETFNEYCFMVRRPALEVMHYLKQANYSMPAIRYILYGKRGAGKTWTLAHIKHFCGTQGWIIVHIPFGAHWVRDKRGEQQMSTHKPGRVDSPLHATEWISKFAKMNEALIKKHDIRVEHDYIWNRRESTVQGHPMFDIIQMGLERTKYATDCVGALLKEIKYLANNGKHKVLVAVDGVNGFWTDSRIRLEARLMPTENFSLIHNFKKMITNDWSGGAIVCTVDANASSRGQRESFLPRYLLGKEGFDMLDPFLPIHVDNYSDKEMESCLDYLNDRLWIQNPIGKTEEGRKELIFLAQNNPLETIRVTESW